MRVPVRLTRAGRQKTDPLAQHLQFLARTRQGGGADQRQGWIGRDLERQVGVIRVLLGWMLSTAIMLGKPIVRHKKAPQMRGFVMVADQYQPAGTCGLLTLVRNTLLARSWQVVEPVA